MIDYFALALTHALIVIALLRVMGREDLDHEDELDDRTRLGRPSSRAADAPQAGGRDDA